MRLLTALVLMAATSCLVAQQPLARDADLPAEPQSNLIASITSPSETPSPQQQQSSSAAQQTTPSQEDSRDEAARELKEEESQRMLAVVPNFNTVISGHAAPLTGKQKFVLFAHSTTDPFVFVITGVTAGYEQAVNSFPEYGQGASGYGKRYGAALADTVDGNFWGNAVLPAIFHQDPRYFRMGHGTFWHRLSYSVATTVICKGDNGKWQANYSNVAGNFIGGAISNVYYPASDRGLALTFERGAVVTAEGALGSLAVEFYPDVASWWSHRHKRVISPNSAVKP